jgi:sigma-B regulation protein RsbU (phosphoserine phosphatase)
MGLETDLAPQDEKERLDAVRRYDVLDTPPDGAFDRITALAAQHFDVPIAIVSIVDQDRIWFKSRHGLEVGEIGRDPGLCASAILQYKPWIVEDAATDPRTLANPLVARDFGLRFYAGAPLTTHDGFNLGTLCLIDQKPRQLTESEATTLSDMAAIVMDELELRLSARRAIDRESELRDHAERTAASLQEGLLPRALPEIPRAQIASLYRPSSGTLVGGDFYDAFELDNGRGWALVVGDVSGKGAEAAAVTALTRHTIRTASLTAEGPAQVLETLNRMMLLSRPDELEHFATVHISFLQPDDDGHRLVTATAGHPPALLFGAAGRPRRIGSHGLPVGLYADAEFTSSHISLAPKDLLLIYTDGISDARLDGQFFGEAGIIAAVGEPRDTDAESTTARLLATLTADGVQIRDDAAALVVKMI